MSTLSRLKIELNATIIFNYESEIISIFFCFNNIYRKHLLDSCKYIFQNFYFSFHMIIIYFKDYTRLYGM